MGASPYKGLPMVVLASGSPRRAELLRSMGVNFTAVRSEVEELTLGRDVPVLALPELLACCKAESVSGRADGIVIGADTIVELDGEPLHKPRGYESACAMLRRLSGREHRVLTGVCIWSEGKRESFTARTDVCFRELRGEEIDYYVRTYRPYDKAGGYGIQEWIGLVGVSWIRGSYTNVVGLPTEALGERLLPYVKQTGREE